MDREDVLAILVFWGIKVGSVTQMAHITQIPAPFGSMFSLPPFPPKRKKVRKGWREPGAQPSLVHWKGQRKREGERGWRANTHTPLPPRSFSSTPSLTVILTLWAGLEHDKDETSNQGEEGRPKAKKEGEEEEKNGNRVKRRGREEEQVF